METDWQLVLVLFLLVLLPAISTRNFLVPGMVIASFLVLVLPIIYGLSTWVIVFAGISMTLLILAVYFIRKKQIFRIEPKVELKTWRIIARPFALLFIPVNTCFGHRFLLYLLGILSIIFISADLYRLFTRRSFSMFFKKEEIQRFSSMTSFMVAIFIVFLLFPAHVAY